MNLILDIIRKILQIQKELVEIDGRVKFFDLRGRWSWCIIIWISTFIVFHISITFFLGFGLISFKENSWFLPSLIIENFLQILGMGYIVSLAWVCQVYKRVKLN